MPVRCPAVRALSISLILCMPACDEAPDCPAANFPGLVVNVRHAVTAEPEAEGATVTVTDGEFVEDLERVSDLSFSGVVERAGTYRITVGKAGFLTWDRGGFVVDRNECNVNTVTVEVALEPEP